MGSFEDHMRYGVAAYALVLVLGAVAVAYGLGRGLIDAAGVALAAGGAVAAFPFAVAGAGFPDIDHHAAKPHRFFRRWVSAIAAVVAGYALYVSGVAAEAGVAVVGGVSSASALPEPVAGAGVAAVGGVVAAGATYLAVRYLKPAHRGVTHSLLTGAVVAAGVGVGVGYVAALGASVLLGSASSGLGVASGGVAGGGFFVGFLSHLQCDGELVGFLPDAM